MKIVHVASEYFPYMKTGGLADAVAALAVELAENGNEVSVFLPGYRAALAHADAKEAVSMLRLKVEMGDEFVSGQVLRFQPRPRLTVHLVCRDEYFDRSHPYGDRGRDYEDNAERFIFFAKGVVETLRLADIRADIVHAHDWQAALTPLLLRLAEQRHSQTLAMKTVFTIHNIAYQGVFPERVFARTNLPAELNGVDGLEYYNQVNFMKGGLLFADMLTTVSPNYAREIQTAEFGCGLDGVVRTRSGELTGILNGIDTRVWNPATDPLLPARYSRERMEGKALCRRALLQAHGMDADFSGPVFGMVCRLVEQKGVDLLLANRSFFMGFDCRLIVLGAGEARYETALREMEQQAPGRVALSTRLDESMSHLIEAGADFFLMPSLFEPCGLNQMYSQAYGTIPLVSRVGGLSDTVTDADGEPQGGTGLVFPPTAEGLADGLQRALRIYADKPRLGVVQRRGMARDFSWRISARLYAELYRDAL